MISTIFAQNPWLFRALLVGIQVLAVVFAVVLVRNDRRWARHVAIALTGIGMLGIIVLTLLPDGQPEAPRACNLEPYMPFGDIPNMTLFFVPALFAVVAWRRPLVVAIIAVLLSASIELVQSVAWLSRRCDIDDLVSNSVGALLAVAIAAIVLRLNRPTLTVTEGAPDAAPSSAR